MKNYKEEPNQLNLFTLVINEKSKMIEKDEKVYSFGWSISFLFLKDCSKIENS